MKLARCILLIPLVGVALMTLVLSGTAFATPSDVEPTYHDLQKQIEQLRHDLKAVEKQLAEIKEAFQGMNLGNRFR